MKTLTQQFQELIEHMNACSLSLGLGDCDCGRKALIEQLIAAVGQRDARVLSGTTTYATAYEQGDTEVYRALVAHNEEIREEMRRTL